MSLLYEIFGKAEQLTIEQKVTTSFTYEGGFSVRYTLIVRSDEALPNSCAIMHDFEDKINAQIVSN